MRSCGVVVSNIGSGSGGVGLVPNVSCPMVVGKCSEGPIGLRESPVFNGSG